MICTVLYYSALYCTLLYCTAMYCTLLCCAMLCFAEPISESQFERDVVATLDVHDSEATVPEDKERILSLVRARRGGIQHFNELLKRVGCEPGVVSFEARCTAKRGMCGAPASKGRSEPASQPASQRVGKRF